MKLPVRHTARTETAIRITSPEFLTDPDDKKKRIPLLCWADEQSNPRRDVCTRELFMAYAGTNEVGERPDGMDRLRDHKFTVHFDDSGKAIGLDVLPARQYGGKMVPTTLVGVRTLKLQYANDGSGVVRVLIRPVNTKVETIAAIIEGLDAANGKSISVGFQPVEGNAAKVVSVADGVVEVKLSSRTAGAQVHALL